MVSLIRILLLTISSSAMAGMVQVNVLTLSNIPLSVNAHSYITDGIHFEVTVSQLDQIQALMQAINQDAKNSSNVNVLKSEVRAAVATNIASLQAAGQGLAISQYVANTSIASRHI